MRKIFLILAICLFPLNLFSKGFVYIKGELFSWSQPYDIGGRPENHGILYGIGTEAEWQLNQNFNFAIISELYGNRFDVEKDLGVFKIYDQLVEFLFIKVVGDLKLKIGEIREIAFIPFLSFGYRRWLKDEEAFENLTPYTQIWRSHFSRIGMELKRPLWKANLSARAGLIIPLSSRMKMNESKIRGRVNFDSKVSGFFEIDFQWKKILLGIYYESLRFPESRNTIDGFVQPETQIDAFGLKWGLVI